MPAAKPLEMDRGNEMEEDEEDKEDEPEGGGCASLNVGEGGREL